MEKLYEKVQGYENMLRYLGTLVDDRTANQIKSLLDKVSPPPFTIAGLVVTSYSIV